MQRNIVILSQKLDLFQANNVGCYEKTHHAAFYLGLHCLPMCHFMSYGMKIIDQVNLRRLKHLGKGEV